MRSGTQSPFVQLVLHDLRGLGRVLKPVSLFDAAVAFISKSSGILNG